MMALHALVLGVVIVRTCMLNVGSKAFLRQEPNYLALTESYPDVIERARE